MNRSGLKGQPRRTVEVLVEREPTLEGYLPSAQREEKLKEAARDMAEHCLLFLIGEDERFLADFPFESPDSRELHTQFLQALGLGFPPQIIQYDPLSSQNPGAAETIYIDQKTGRHLVRKSNLYESGLPCDVVYSGEIT